MTLLDSHIQKLNKGIAIKKWIAKNVLISKKIVIRYNRGATQSKCGEGLPRSTTRVHVVCALLRGPGQKREPPLIKKVALTRWRCVEFVPTKTI